MLFIIKGSTFSACRYYRNVVNRVKSFETWYPLFHNLHGEPSNPKFYSTDSDLPIIDASVKQYLNHLMNEYQNENEQKGAISKILKLHQIPILLNEKIKIAENIKSLSELVNSNEEIKKLAKEEESLYEQQMFAIDQKILNTILQQLGGEHYDNVILEIVPGVGGQEAMLFAKDLLTMYTCYMDYLGMTYEMMELLESDLKGIRKAVILVSDSKAFERLQFEGGVHRVQRVPSTEKSGRLHTSTAVVTVLPEPRDVDIQLDEKDLKVEAKKSSGAGGQHVNCTNSAIRITHIPTGTVVTCQSDRSQMRNKKLAMRKLKSVLYQAQLDEQDSFMSNVRKKQMGGRMRNEKIRTYNYNQDRITDHRIPNGTMYNLKEFMRHGEFLAQLEERLHKDLQRRTLLEIIGRTAS